MKRILKTIAISVSAVAVLASCDLNLVPIDSITYEEGGQLIQTEANLTALENGVLHSFRALQMGKYSLTSDLMMDGFNATLDYGNNYGSVHRVTADDFNSGDYDVRDYWMNNYIALKNYNILIAAAETANEDLKDKVDVVLGEALFCRAMSYLNLARHFGKAYNSATAATDLCVPLVLVYDQLEKPSRATVAEVYAQIKADLDKAATLLANVKGSARAEKPTIDAVNALYARYYIDLGDYANAAAYAHKVIDTKNYKLSSTAKEMEDEFVNDNGKEPIYQVYTNLSSEGSNALREYTMTNSDTQFGQVFKPYYIPTQKLIDSYDAGDLRLAAWFDNSEAVQINGSYYQGDFYVFTKYWGNPSLTSNLRNGRQAPKPLMIAEMYLIAAEAELTSNAAAAKADLNTLQAARGARTTDATLENIQKEWFRETVGDGLRMVTMKRWGLGYDGRPAQPGAKNALNLGANYDQKVLPASDHHFCWPVPADEMNINKNLVQNPGYGI